MSGGYGCTEGLRQPTAEVLAMVELAVAREALGYHGRPEGSHTGVGGGRVNLRPSFATSRTGGRAAGATCPV